MAFLPGLPEGPAEDFPDGATVGVNFLAGAFFHDLQHQMCEAEQFMACMQERVAAAGVLLGGAAVECLAGKCRHLGGIMPVNPQRNAFALDFQLDLLCLSGKVLESAHVFFLRAGLLTRTVASEPTF